MAVSLVQCRPQRQNPQFQNPAQSWVTLWARLCVAHAAFCSTISLHSDPILEVHCTSKT
jgi:hypothetical protein